MEAWSDTRGAFIVDAGESTPTMEDVDYVNVGGQWYRIGVFHAHVMQDGSVSGFDCPSRSAGGPCD